MSEFYWHYEEDGNGDSFFKCEATTREDAVKEAKQKYKKDRFDPSDEDASRSVWVAEGVELPFDLFRPTARQFIDEAIVEAHDSQGEWADDWMQNVSPKELNELNDQLSKVWGNWLKKYGFVKKWGELKDVMEYPMGGVRDE